MLQPNDSQPHNNWTTAEKQALRLKRFGMAFAAYFCNGIVVGIMSWQGFLPPGTFGFLYAIMIGINLTFYILIRSGFNLRFKDPSLTFEQLLVATFFLLSVTFYIQHARGVILMLFVTAHIFGVFQLTTGKFIILDAFAAATYALVIALLQTFRPETINLKLEIMNWLAMTGCLVALGLVGGYLSKLRHKLGERNAALKDACAEIEKLAITDELTKSHNRRHMLVLIEKEMSRSSRTCHSFCVALIDLDHFKKINDTFGHLAGDVVLVTFASQLEQHLRNMDSFGRYGGEEFILLMPEIRLESAREVVERLRNLCMNLDFKDIDASLKVTFSAGVAQFERGEHIDQLFHRADEALYEAKASGRNQVHTKAKRISA